MISIYTYTTGATYYKNQLAFHLPERNSSERCVRVSPWRGFPGSGGRLTLKHEYNSWKELLGHLVPRGNYYNGEIKAFKGEKVS